jgi:hypothetical protein
MKFAETIIAKKVKKPETLMGLFLIAGYLTLISLYMNKSLEEKTKLYQGILYFVQFLLFFIVLYFSVNGILLNRFRDGFIVTFIFYSILRILDISNII